MTRVLNDPTNFAREHLRGFCLLQADLVMPVPGGVVRVDRPEGQTAAVVTGGGSGHYPAFCGWVGPGMADAAVSGDVFASPSAEAIVSVCRSADNGRGILLTYGNYAGDVLNFTEAQQRKPTGSRFATCPSLTMFQAPRRRSIIGGAERPAT